jgi:tetratricopeptide (TPR) repeat protein
LISFRSNRSAESCLSPEDIIRYIDKKCTPVECTLIENHLLECDLCFEAVEGISESAQGELLRSDLKSINSKLNKKSRKPIYKVYYPAAAVIAFIIFTLMLVPGKSPGEKIFDEYFEPYQNVVPIMRGDEVKLITSKAFQSYESKDYKEASGYFEEVHRRNPNDKKVCFYYGISLLMLDKNDDALIYLKKAAGDNLLFEQADYYFALALLRLDDFDKAAEVLNEIVRNGSSYSAAANKILNDIR